MAKKYCISTRSVKHMLYTKIYKRDKLGAIKLPSTCKWHVLPTVGKKVELELSDFSKGSKFPHFSAVMSSLTTTEALKLSDSLRKAAKDAKECPPAEKQRLEKMMKNAKKLASGRKTDQIIPLTKKEAKKLTDKLLKTSKKKKKK